MSATGLINYTGRLCGILGQAIGGYSLGGLLVSIVVGFAGALIGLWFFQYAHPPELWLFRVGDVEFPIIWSIIGATVFVLIVGMFRRRPYYY